MSSVDEYRPGLGPRLVGGGRVDQERWWLRFRDRRLEAVFRRDYDRTSLPRVRLAGVLAILLYAAFGYLDTRAVHGGVGWIWLVRAIVVAVIAVELSLSWTKLADHLQQLALCFTVIVATLGLDIMNAMPAVPSDYAYSGTMLILIFLCTFVRTRFTVCFATTVAVVVMYEVSEAIRGVDELTWIFNNFFLLSFVVVGLAARHAARGTGVPGVLARTAPERGTGAIRRALAQHSSRIDRVACLRDTPSAIADSADEVTVLFADIVGFTPIASGVTPTELVSLLDGLFSKIDDLCERHGVEKIKTIGDAYMAVAGVPSAMADHAGAVAELALDLRDLALAETRTWPSGLQIRIGICSGPVVAGVIGQHKFAYDLWGDTVNTAARMESHGTPGTIHVASSTRVLLADRYLFTDPVQVDVKGKGLITTYLLLERATIARSPGPEPSQGEQLGREPSGPDDL